MAARSDATLRDVRRGGGGRRPVELLRCGLRSEGATGRGNGVSFSSARWVRAALLYSQGNASRSC